MELLYSDQEIVELAQDYGLRIDKVTEMLAAGFDPDGRYGPSMALDMDGEPGYCPTCRYEHADGPC